MNIPPIRECEISGISHLIMETKYNDFLLTSYGFVSPMFCQVMHLQGWCGNIPTYLACEFTVWLYQ